MIVAALVARELGGGKRAQVIAAVGVAAAPILLATNGLFQPVSFDSLMTMIVLWLALRLAFGRGSWTWIGIAVGVGLETKYTLAIPLVLLVAAFLSGAATSLPLGRRRVCDARSPRAARSEPRVGGDP